MSHARIAELARCTPRDIDDAIACMEQALDTFHALNDNRAVFLRAYYIITCNVRHGILRSGRFRDADFLYPEWMSRLAGKFATLYFRSLAIDQAADSEPHPWRIAHQRAADRRSSVTEDLLIGIITHIKYDLAIALLENMRESGDAGRPRVLAERKRDHDYANRFLADSIDEIVRDLTADYGGRLSEFDRCTLGFGRRLVMQIIRGYREQVWSYAVAMLDARSAGDEAFVRQEIRRWSVQTANRVSGRTFPPIERLHAYLGRRRHRVLAGARRLAGSDRGASA